MNRFLYYLINPGTGCIFMLRVSSYRGSRMTEMIINVTILFDLSIRVIIH